MFALRVPTVMRISRFITVSPSLRTDGVRSESRETLAAFPTSALPDFSRADWNSAGCGTIRPSDSLRVVCLPYLFSLSGILDPP